MEVTGKISLASLFPSVFLSQRQDKALLGTITSH